MTGQDETVKTHLVMLKHVYKKKCIKKETGLRSCPVLNHRMVAVHLNVSTERGKIRDFKCNIQVGAQKVFGNYVPLYD